MKIDISLGELIDKMSILHIKKRRITDPPKQTHIIQEWNAIVEHVKPYFDSDNITPIEYYMTHLIDINDKIWVEEDKLRESTSSDEELVKTCKNIQRENDARCRIKKKINQIISDPIQEQKSYTTRIAIIVPHLGIGDQMMTCGLIRYMSFYYDHLFLLTKKRYIDSVRHMYCDDTSISLISITDTDCFVTDHNLAGIQQQIKNEYHIDHVDIIWLGLHCLYNQLFHKYKNSQPDQHTQIIDLTELRKFATDEQRKYERQLLIMPYKLIYTEVNIPYEYRWQYFYIARDIQKEKALKIQAVGETSPYIFIHDDPTRDVDITSFIEENMEQWKEKYSTSNDKHDLIIYHPNRSIMNNSWSGILSNCLTDYIYLMLNATVLCITDSAFFCMIDHYQLQHIKEKHLFMRSYRPQVTCQPWSVHILHP